jgi:hypothetical protein
VIYVSRIPKPFLIEFITASRVFVNRYCLLALLMIVTVVFVSVVVASMVNGVGYYLISLAVLLGMGVGIFLLLVRVVKRLP